MKTINLSTILIFALGVSFSACKKDLVEDVTSPAEKAGSFDYKTADAVNISITGESYLAHAVFDIYTANPENGGKLIGRTRFDESGNFNQAFTLPLALESIYIQSISAGLPSGEVPVMNGQIHFNAADFSRASGKMSSGNLPAPNAVNNTVYNYMGTYNSSGVPNYLVSPNDVISTQFLADVNASLPEFQSVPATKPFYIASSNQSEIELTDSGEVWITFVHEGAANLNSLGFFTYKKGNPPTNPSDIDSVHIIFPNVSNTGSQSTGVLPGNKVYLGKFVPGDVIGWVLFQAGYNTGTQSVNTGATKFWSNPDWNPEVNASNRTHNVLLWDATRKYMILGFEDINREAVSCDHDFNDALFYLTGNPYTSIYNPGVPRLRESGCPDTDGDGVNDCQDDFPNDDDRAFKVHTPYDSGFSSVAFEDLWPAKGDFDFNDLVMDINYVHVVSAEHELVDIEYRSVVRHIGASYTNGFGIEFPFSIGNLGSVNGPVYTEGIISTNGAGTEVGQSKDVVVFFDNANFNYQDTMLITGTLSSPVSFSQFVLDGLNPFCIVDKVRSKEIHLKGKPATDLANVNDFGLIDDVTDPVNDIWYEATTGEPWGISVSHEYAPMVENVSIEQGYLKWNIWVASNGSEYPDWYQDDPGYRNSANIQ